MRGLRRVFLTNSGIAASRLVMLIPWERSATGNQRLCCGDEMYRNPSPQPRVSKIILFPRNFSTVSDSSLCHRRHDELNWIKQSKLYKIEIFFFFRKYTTFLPVLGCSVALLGIGRFEKTRNCNPTGAYYVRYVRISVARLLGWEFQLQRHSLNLLFV